MARNKAKPARPAPHHGAAVAAPGGAGNGEAGDLTLDYETAVLSGLWPLWWALTVEREGIAAVVVYPLENDAEAAAQRFVEASISLTYAQFAVAERRLDATTGKAVKAFSDCLPLMQQEEGGISLPDDLYREVEWLVGMAAMPARILYLLRRKQEGVH